MQGCVDSEVCADTSVQHETVAETATSEAHAMGLEAGAEHAADPSAPNGEHKSKELIDCEEEAAGAEQAPAPAPALAPALEPDDRPYQLEVHKVSTNMHP